MNRKEFYNSLSEDVKARIRACESEEEMMKVLRENMIELDPDLLGDVSGGLGHHICNVKGSKCGDVCRRDC